jgi:3-dehydroquinate synthase
MSLLKEYLFNFGGIHSRVYVRRFLPSPEAVFGESSRALLVCDTHTEAIARRVAFPDIPICVLESGEKAKTWDSLERIIRSARDAGLGRDGLFVGVGGGVVGDLSGFAASIFMRGVRFRLVSTTLLGMVDAAVGGKTGFDLLGIKNLAGSFYPAEEIHLPLECLDSLPPAEWKSGMAELIKTAVLGDGEFLALVKSLGGSFSPDQEALFECVSRAAALKGGIVERDPRETGGERALLNLGHTFGHALESAAGLGVLSHGEAVGWGMVRACELGLFLGITPRERAEEITGIMESFGYETRAPHPLIKGKTADFMGALGGDKKKKAGKLAFVLPAREGAVLTGGEALNAALSKSFPESRPALSEETLIRGIINGEFSSAK